jgi:membrane-associated phospholipid phosphatase
VNPSTVGGAATSRDQTQVPEPAPKRRRRPSGEAPPLPHPLRASGKLLLAGTGVVVLLLVLLFAIPGLGTALTHADVAVLKLFEDIRTEPVTDLVRDIDALGSDWTIGLLRWATVLALIAFRRFRHLFVTLATVLLVSWITSGIAMLVTRPRPLEIEIIGHWEGSPFPSRPVAALAVTLIGITYCIVPPGRARGIAKFVSAALVFALGLAELYLGSFHPIDVAVGAVLGAAIPVILFRLLTPNEAFPVTYRRGRAAHLDVSGPRGEAIRRAVQDQLGITILDIKPFGLAGSGGSTPVRLRVADEPHEYLFAKVYASNHLRADRWYKLGRTLLYGRLEDEGSFSTVRRLIQYEDYMLRVMRDSGLNVPDAYGFVEITPEREYLLVTEFVEGATEIVDSEVDDEVIDDALLLVRRLWDAGIAHRDIKPSNLLVRDGKVHLIDVAFGQIRPSPWRQAVDLANIMLVLAFRSDPDRVYNRALRFFTPDDIAEAFAATHSVTMPSQSRSMLRKDRRDLLARFRALAPKRPPVAIQRWSLRRVGLTAGMAIAVFLLIGLAGSNLQGAGLLADPEAAQASFSFTGIPECGNLEELDGQLVLEAQSVPSASKVPCLDSLPLGWTFRAVEVQDGESRMILDSDRGGVEAAEVILTSSCDVSEATEVPSDELDARRFEEIQRLDEQYSGFRYYRFQGGCATYRFDFRGEGRTALAQEVALAVGFLARDQLEEVVRKDFDLDL